MFIYDVIGVIWFNRYVVVGGMQGDTLHPLNDSIS